jgi:xanthosine utilization system XapX-like protein
MMRPGLTRGLVFGLPLGAALWVGIIYIIVEVVTP